MLILMRATSAPLSRHRPTIRVIPEASLGITGSIAVTLDVFVPAAVGQVQVSGTVAVTLDSFVPAATGQVQVSGTIAVTLDALVPAAVGQVQVSGTSSNTLDVFVANGAGSVGSAVSGSIAVTLGVFVPSASGQVQVSGTVAVTLGSFVAAAAGQVQVSGTIAVTLSSFVPAATGSVLVSGTSSNTLDIFVSNGAGNVSSGVSGTVSVTLASFISAAVGAVLVSGTSSQTLSVFISNGSGIVGTITIIEGGHMAGIGIITRLTAATNTLSIQIRSAVKLNWAHLTYTSDATVGNRTIVLEVLDDAGNIVLDVHTSANQAASLTRHHEFFPGVYRETAFSTVGAAITTPIPMGLIIPGNYILRVRDSAAIAAGDSLVFTYQTSETE